MCWCTPAMRTPRCHRLECKPFVPKSVYRIKVLGLELSCEGAVRIRDELNKAFPAPNSMQVRDEMLADRYGSAPA